MIKQTVSGVEKLFLETFRLDSSYEPVSIFDPDTQKENVYFVDLDEMAQVKTNFSSIISNAYRLVGINITKQAQCDVVEVERVVDDKVKRNIVSKLREDSPGTVSNIEQLGEFSGFTGRLSIVEPESVFGDPDSAVRTFSAPIIEDTSNLFHVSNKGVPPVYLRLRHDRGVVNPLKQYDDYWSSLDKP